MTVSGVANDSATVRERPVGLPDLRQVIEAVGEDTTTFLQGQLSQDVAAMAPGETRWSLLLHPQGKIASWLRVTRAEDSRFFLDVDAGWAVDTVARLERFKLRTRCEFTVMPWRSLTLVGPGVGDLAVDGVHLDLDDSLAGIEARVVFGPAPEAEVEVVEPSAAARLATALRIEAGRPAMGAELDESTIPAAAGIVDDSVSFTKGCYTGQELVARIDSRGSNVPSRLVGLVFHAGAGEPAPGSALVVDGATVGSITSVGHSGLLGAVVALGHLKRGVDIGATVECGDIGGAEVRELPLIGG